MTSATATLAPPAAGPAAAAASHTFIRAVEVWVPSSDGTLLELDNGLFSAAPRFGALSRTMCFGRGEGLPGRVWDEGRPILLKHFAGSYFRRIAAAEAAGLTCGLAVPWFRNGRIAAVLVMFCGDVRAHTGAIELWRNDPRVTGDMTLDDGYYGTSPEALESLSRDTYLPPGTGLPGLAWQARSAVFIDDLGASTRFLRADVTTHAGIRRGLAFPCAMPGDTAWVASFLSSPESPIARRMESWKPSEDGRRLHRAFVSGEARPDPAELMLDRAPGTVGRAFLTGVPAVSDAPAGEPAVVGHTAAAQGWTGLAAIPVMVDEVVSEVVVLYF